MPIGHCVAPLPQPRRRMMSAPDRKLVLIVDDTPTNVAVVSGVLKDLFKTKVATNGEKALAIATAAEKPDLILLDVMMPGMDGYEVCRRLKANPSTRRNSSDLPHGQDRLPRRGEGLRGRRGRLHPQAVLEPHRARQGQDPTGASGGAQRGSGRAQSGRHVAPRAAAEKGRRRDSRHRHRDPAALRERCRAVLRRDQFHRLLRQA